MKIAIVGLSGGGKTTLGRFLAKRHVEPFLEVDALLEQANYFRETDPEKKRRIFEQVKKEIDAFKKSPDWVIDHNHQLLDRRQVIRESDRVIFFDFPLHVRAVGNIRRHIIGEKRIHHFWSQVLPRTIRYHRRRRREMLGELSGVSAKITTIRSRDELKKLMDAEKTGEERF